MRRSRSIRLVLLGATAVTLGACGDEDLSQGEYYPDEASCQRAGGTSCAQAFAEARQRHAETAPQFAGLAECEQQYGTGNCEMAQDPPAATAPPPPPPPAEGSPPPPPPSTTGSATTTGGGTTTYRTVHYFPLMHGFTYYSHAPTGSMGMPIYQDRAGNAFSGRTQVGRFSSGNSFQSTTSSRRGGFGSFRSASS